MNIRNIQIFGLKELKLGKRVTISLVVLIFIVALFIGIKKYAPSESTSFITGTTTIDTTKEAQQSQQQSEQQTQQESVNQTENQTQVSAEGKLFIEYGPTCGVEIKRAEDDLSDVNSYLFQHQSEHDALQSEYDNFKSEYEEKLKELELQYLPKLNLIKSKIEQDNKNLGTVTKKLEDIKGQCEIEPR